MKTQNWRRHGQSRPRIVAGSVVKSLPNPLDIFAPAP
jgi:hypothetical protein